MMVTQAYRFELAPSNAARSVLAAHAGAARFAFNWGLAHVENLLHARRVLIVLALRQGASRAEAEAWASGIIGPVPWTLPALRRSWNRAKGEVAPWWPECSKETYSSGLDALARGFKAYWDSRVGQCAGRQAGWPSRKRRHRSRRSFRITTGSFGMADGRHVRLPRIGLVRTKEPTVKLTRKLACGTARVLSVTVTETAGRWYCSFTCQVNRNDRPAAQPAAVVGVDVGVRSLAVLSTGQKIPNPKHAARYARRIARLQRQRARRDGPVRGRAPSRRWRRANYRFARAHRKVACARADGLAKLSSWLAASWGTVVVEDLNVAGMTATAKGSGCWRGKAGLNRAILDAAPGELRRQLAYKTTWRGGSLILAGRWYPSSKTCCRCGTVKTKLSLAERTFRCGWCGLVMDRDHNAARNLAALMQATTYSHSGTASGAGTGQRQLANAQGDGRFMPMGRWPSMNCEDGTGPRGPGKTATAARQQAAARRMSPTAY